MSPFDALPRMRRSPIFSLLLVCTSCFILGRFSCKSLVSLSSFVQVRRPWSGEGESNLKRLKQCERWAKQKPESEFLEAILHMNLTVLVKACPIPHALQSGRGNIDPTTGAVLVAVDALEMCGVIGKLMDAGLLPRDVSVLQDSDLVLLDVGAAFGTEMLVGHSLGFEVWSFEARESEYNQLVKDWDGRLGLKTHIVHAAISNIPGGKGTLQLFNADDSSSVHSDAVKLTAEANKVKREKELGHELVMLVPAMSLDHALGNDTKKSRVAFIKIDTQGHEYEVLQSANEILRSDKPHLYFEYAPHLRNEAPQVLCFVKSFGYKCGILRGGLMVLCIHRDARVYH